MKDQSHLAAWAALVVSIATLVVVVGVAGRPEPVNRVAGLQGDVSHLSDDVRALAADVEAIRDAIGVEPDYGDRDGSGLWGALDVASRAASVASDTASEVRSIVESMESDVKLIDARLSDLCFRLGYC